jgi:hypothetical protein
MRGAWSAVSLRLLQTSARVPPSAKNLQTVWTSSSLSRIDPPLEPTPMRSCVVRSPLLDTFTAADLQPMDFPPINYIIPGYVEGLTPVGRQAKAQQVLAGTRLALATAYGGTACGSRRRA